MTRLAEFVDTYGGLLLHVTLHHPLRYRFTQVIPRAMFAESRSLDCPGFNAGAADFMLRVVTHVPPRKHDGRSVRNDFSLYQSGELSVYVIMGDFSKDDPDEDKGAAGAGHTVSFGDTSALDETGMTSGFLDTG